MAGGPAGDATPDRDSRYRNTNLAILTGAFLALVRNQGPAQVCLEQKGQLQLVRKADTPASSRGTKAALPACLDAKPRGFPGAGVVSGGGGAIEPESSAAFTDAA